MPYRETQAVRDRKSAQRRALLHAAEKQVREQGFSGLTVQSLAQASGVAVGTVYRYFGNKDELVCEVFRNATGREVAALAEALEVEGSVAERLQHGCRRFAERALKAPQLAWSLIAEPVGASLADDRLRYREAYAALFADVLAEGVAKGELPPQPEKLTAAALVGGLAEALLGPISSSGAIVMNEMMITQLCSWCLRAAGCNAQAIVTGEK